MSSSNFTFFDFCAGIGAGHTALTRLGGLCIGFSEINPKSEITYRKIHQADKNQLKNWGNLTKINTNKIPDFDVMIGGFPCQSFSIVGQRKGMKDERGQIIFSLAKILKKKRTKYFLLENVKGLVNHDKGRTLQEVLKLLRKIGYKVEWKVLKSSDYGIPQIRERVYFIGVREDLVDNNFKFSFPEPIKTKKNMGEFLVDNDPSCIFDENIRPWQTFMKYLNNKYNKGIHDLDKLLKEDYLILDMRQSDLRLYRNECPTLRTGRHGILYVKNGKLRKLSGKESLLLQGFDLTQTKRAKSVSQTDLLSQAGNAFTVNVIEEILKEMIRQLPFDTNIVYSQLEPKKHSQLKLNILTEHAYEH